MDNIYIPLTEKGWPRPLVGADKLPVPWVSPPADLSQVIPERMSEVVDYGLCQICGLEPEPNEKVYLFVNLESGPKPEQMEDKIVQAMDNAILHERCMRLAIGRCPCLKKLRANKMLVMYSTVYSNVKIFTADDDGDILGVDGELVTECQL